MIAISEDNNKKNSVKIFKFLNSFRGLCALIVVIAHSHCCAFKLNNEDFYILTYVLDTITNFVQTLAVNGFFILSSFLLTYRFISDLSNLKEQKDFEKKRLLSIIFKYLVRRFFRVYVPFFIFSFLAMQEFKNWKYSIWLDLITLRNIGHNHLWTIAPEIKYYFILPFICLPVIYIKFKWSLIFMILSLFSINFLNIHWNLFNLNYIEGGWGDPELNFRLSLPIFLNGSLIAFILFYLETFHESFFEIKIKDKITNVGCICLTIFGVWYSSKYKTENMIFFSPFQFPGMIWSLVIFMMLISNENTNIIKTHLLERFKIFQTMGKFSFSIYLWHKLAIDFVLLINQVFPDLDWFSIYGKYLILTCTICLISYIYYYCVENISIRFSHKICKKIDLLLANNK